MSIGAPARQASAYGATGPAAITTGSFTVPAGDAIYAFGYTQGGVNGPPVGISDSQSLTWTNIYSLYSGNIGLTVWRAFSNGNAMTVTYTPKAGITATIQSVLEIVSVANASNYVGNIMAEGSGAGDPSPSLPSAPADGSMVFGWFMSNQSHTVTPPTGWTETYEGSPGGTYTTEVAYDDTSPTQNPAWTSTGSLTVLAVAIEVRELGSAGTAAGGATVTGSSAAVKASGGSVAGAATVAGASGAINPSPGAAAGVAAASGASQAVAGTAGAAAGAATVTGAGYGIGSTGTAAGIATASGASQAVAATAGTINGSAATTGTSGAVLEAGGAADGSAAVSGESGSVGTSPGSAAGAAVSTGASNAIAAVAGTSAGNADVLGASDHAIVVITPADRIVFVGHDGANELTLEHDGSQVAFLTHDASNFVYL
jgi:hypothetical protein